jgi:hypothetical protein
LTFVAGLEAPERGDFERVRDQRDLERSGAQAGDRERDAVDRSEPFSTAVAQDQGPARLRRRLLAHDADCAEAVDVSLDEVAQPSGSPTRAAVSEVTSSRPRGRPSVGARQSVSGDRRCTEKRPFSTRPAVRTAP